MGDGLLKRMADILIDPSKTLPAARRKVINVALSDPERVVDESFEMLARRAGSSVPTVMRTVRDLGFPGLREFKLALAQELAIAGSPVNRRVALSDATEDVMQKVVRSAAAAVAGVTELLTAEVLNEAVDAIVAAHRVDCWSVGATSSFMASDLQARLFRMGITANAYFDSHLQLVSAAMQDANCVAFAVSHVGGMPSLLEAVEVARTQRAKVIALTQPNSPLARRADIVLPVRVTDDPVMHVGTDAYLAHLAVIEILTVLIAQRMGETVVNRMRDVREVLANHGVDTRGHPFLRWQPDR